MSAPAARADAGAADWTLIAKVVGAVAGGVGWVAVVGTAVLWIRFNDVDAPATQSVVAAASTASATITNTTGTGCSWTASDNVSWITITAGSSGTGSGTTSYSVAANTSATARTGVLTIAGQTVTVTQAGAALPPQAPGNLRIVRPGG